jgi:alkylation response protein AidB-like acyl-CoA dehydrogenase
MAMAGLDGGRLSIGACSLGAAQACFELAVNYTKVCNTECTSVPVKPFTARNESSSESRFQRIREHNLS